MNVSAKKIWITFAAVVAVSTWACAEPVNEKAESDLREELWSLVSSLRQLQQDHYQKQTTRSKQFKLLRDESSQLKLQVEELSKQKDMLDKGLDQTQAKIAKLETEKQTAHAIELATAKKLDTFVNSQSDMIAHGIPYKKQERLNRLKGTDSRENKPVSDRLANIWSFTQEELRIARSGEIYTDQVQLDESRVGHARLFRVGHLISGYLTEQDGQAGIWVERKGWKAIKPGQINSVIKSINILDKKLPPEYVQMPIQTKPVDMQKKWRG